MILALALGAKLVRLSLSLSLRLSLSYLRVLVHQLVLHQSRSHGT